MIITGILKFLKRRYVLFLALVIELIKGGKSKRI